MPVNAPGGGSRATKILCLLGVSALPAITGSAVRPNRPVQAAEAGRISGTVVLSQSLSARRPRFRIYADAGIGATPPSRPAPTLKDEYANVVIYLELDGAKALAAVPSPHPGKPTMTQREEQFIPHVLPVVRGATVEFPNEDDIFHNVFSLSGTRTFDLAKYPAGTSRSVDFPRSGVVNVFCHIHADMSAVILVRDNPFFVSPDTSGVFSLEGIPPGDYTLVAWHERIKPVTSKVKIVAGQTTRTTFNIPLPQPVER